MTRITKHIIGIILILISAHTEAQELGFNFDNLSKESNKLEAKIMGKVYYITAQANSNFLFPSDWAIGEITLTNGDQYKDIKMRYHADVDELIAYNTNLSSLFYVEKEQIQSFSMNIEGNMRKFIKLNHNNKNREGRFFEELYSGTQKFLSFRYVYRRKVNPFEDQLGIMRDVEYQIRTDYYRYSSEMGYKKISISRRGLLFAFPKHKKQIRRLLRENKIVVDNELTMARVFVQLDELGILD